jgi:uncharacterized protein
MPVRPDLSETKNSFDARLLEQLACPVCHGGLRLAVPEERIVCAGCGRKYLLVEGIPVLIAERAIPAE